jgi:membrane-bound ClpP family serine protease
LLARSLAPIHGAGLASGASRRFTASEERVVSSLGVALLVLGAALAVAEAHVPSHGALGGSGAVVAALGLALVVSGAGLGIAAAVAAGLVAGLVGVAYALLAMRAALRASHRRVRSGAEGLIGRVGEARSPGQVFLDGALWRARMWAVDEHATLARGDPIVVERVDGLTLTVRPAEEWEVSP